MSTVLALVAAVVLLALNAVFVGAEFSLVTARRSQIQPRAESGARNARATLRAMEHVSLMMAGTQLGITVCSVLLGAVAEPAIGHLIEPLTRAVDLPHDAGDVVAGVVTILLVVYLHVVLGEMVPKNIAIAEPDRAALLLAPFLYRLVMLLRPVIAGLNAVANNSVRLLRVEPKDEVSAAYTREEVAALVEESHGEGLLREEEYGRLTGALGFAERSVREVILPLERLTVVRRGASGAEVEALCGATGYSRFPVAAESGELVGYLHIKDVLEPDEARRRRPVEEKWVRPFATVAPDDLLHDALETLQRRGAHMARVIDGDGATIGLATLEDLIEELVGEIRDAAHAGAQSAVPGS